MAEPFQFLHPQWLWALLPLAVVLGSLWQRPDRHNPWRRVVAPNLQPLLLGDGSAAGHRRRRQWLTLLATGWLLAVVALADPVWDRAPSPVYQSQTALVIVLDLSLSMLTPDLAPDRLTRARFKVEDIVRLAGEGQVGLVVFAGDAFTVTPLTRDAATLRSQLRALEPGIMPVQGSRADLGLRQAGELLQQAGLKSGEVLLVADGVEGQYAAAAAAQLRGQGYRVAVMGVGTLTGAPLTAPGGHALRDGDGRVIVPRLEHDALREVADAGGGPYVGIRPDDSDVRALLLAGTTGSRVEQSGDPATAPRWNERGPWLVVLLLPLALLAFRRGWLFSVVLLAAGMSPSPPVMAAADASPSAWANLWRTPEQQAAQALSRGDFERASALSDDPLRRGAARYRQGDYAAALTDFGQAPGAEGSYNRGNALAKLGRYKDAISAYDDALAARPGMPDAVANKAAIEALLEQQRRQREQQQAQQQPDDSQQQDGQQDGQDQQPKNGSGADRQEQTQAQQQTASGQQGAQDQQQDAGGDGTQPQQAQPQGGGREGGADAQADAARQPLGDRQAAGDDAGQQLDHESADAQHGDPKGQQKGKGTQADAGVPAGDRDDKAGGAARQAPGAPKDGGDERHRNAFADAVDELARRGEQPDDASGPSPAAPAQQVGDAPPGAGSADAEALDSEERLAAEQWLRRIPDDPGGLLRRKFQYQYQQRRGSADSGSRQGW